MRYAILASLLFVVASIERQPLDSDALRSAIARGEQKLDCGETRRAARRKNSSALDAIDSAFCMSEDAGSSPANELPSPDSCYLISTDRVLGSVRSLECFGLQAESHHPSLPSFPAWGFLHPSCWSYVRIRRRAAQPPLLIADWRVKQLAEAAAQEWQHPTWSKYRRSLRVAVRGRCLPFLLDDLPHQLAQGRMRRDTLSTTVTKLRKGSSTLLEEERRVAIVERCVATALTSRSHWVVSPCLPPLASRASR